MVRKYCAKCKTKPASVLRYDRSILCKECFIWEFEEEVHRTITENELFKPGQKVAIGASGGKDSAVLMRVMQVLNERHNYGLDRKLYIRYIIYLIEAEVSDYFWGLSWGRVGLLGTGIPEKS